MKKIFSVCLALAGLVLLLTACSNKQSGSDSAKDSWDKIEKSKTLKVATSGTLFPQSYHDDDNNLTGYDVEILKEVGKRLGLKVKFEEMGVDGTQKRITKMQINSSGQHHISIHLLL